MSRQFTEPPDVGVYPRIDADVYHTWPALSQSWLNKLKRSPAHLKAYLEKETKDTPAMLFGRAGHAAILEPDVFSEKWRSMPDGLDRRSKAGRLAYDNLLLELGPDGAGYILSHDDYQRALGMRDAVWKNKAAAMLLGAEGDAELSVVWDRWGVKCKARLDRMSWKLKGGTVTDLKTTTDARRPAFERRIWEMGYHRQGAWYLDGLRARKVAIEHYAIIAVESEPPYGSVVYRVTERALAAGWQEIEPLVELYSTCLELDQWPAYTEKVEDIGLPAFAWREIESTI